MCPCEGRDPAPAFAGVHKRRGTSEQAFEQIRPVGVHRLDLAQFPRPLPLFHLPFAQPRAVEFVMRLVPDERLAAVAPREPVGDILAMLPCALDEVAGRADVDRPVAPARHDVDIARPVHRNPPNPTEHPLVPLRRRGSSHGPSCTPAKAGVQSGEAAGALRASRLLPSQEHIGGHAPEVSAVLQPPSRAMVANGSLTLSIEHVPARCSTSGHPPHSRHLA